ncbi:MAG: TolC family protein [Candidatus Omnitrophota bacterium]
MKRIFCFIIFFFLIFEFSFANDVVSLDALISEALVNNPEILAAKKKFEAASTRIFQSASLNDPVFEFEYDKMTADRMLTGKPMKTISVSQTIPFPTKLYLKAKIASKLAKMEYENYKAKEREIIARVKSSYSELLLINKTMELAYENKAILEQFSKSATARYSTATGTQIDVLRAQVEIAKIDNELVMLEQKLIAGQAMLNVLLDRDPKNSLGILSPQAALKFTKTLDEFYALAKENNPELKAYGYLVDKGKAAYSLAINEFAPDFMVKYSRMIDSSEKDWAGMVGVTIPLWFFQKQVFGVKEMKAELEMLKAESKAKENLILFEVQNSYSRILAAKKIIELFEVAFIPQAEQALAAALKAYETEKLDFLSLLDSQRMIIDFKLEHYKAILELRIALADLEKAVGKDLEFN